jgi:GNAT superfamily N-acetyltransferase
MIEGKDAARFSIRRALREDAAALVSLSEQLGYPTTAGEIEGRLASILSDPDQIVLVAEAEGQAIAWIQGATVQTVESERSVEILGLVVEEKRRSAGVGRELLGRAEAWARKKGARRVMVRSNVIRTRAHAFYQRLGYEITKTQHAFRKKLD